MGKNDPKKPKEESKTKKGKCIEINPDTNIPGKGVCEYKDCTLKSSELIMGYYCVEYDGKTYHASCATQLGIQFKIPLAPKRKRLED